MISFDEFKKVEMRIGKIVSAERIQGSDKLLKLQVDFGGEKRQIVSGIGKTYNPEDIAGKNLPFITNLEPRTLMGNVSEGMILATGSADNVVLLIPDKDISCGAIIK